MKQGIKSKNKNTSNSSSIVAECLNAMKPDNHYNRKWKTIVQFGLNSIEVND